MKSIIIFLVLPTFTIFNVSTRAFSTISSTESTTIQEPTPISFNNKTICLRPTTSPWHPTARATFRRLAQPACGPRPPLTRIVKSEDKRRSWVIVDPRPASARCLSTVYCCYRILKRVPGAGIAKNTYSKCKRFRTKFEIGARLAHIKCICRKSRNRRSSIYTYIHAHASTTFQPERWPKNQRKFSVMILGIDTVSRLNSIRSLPMTRKFIESVGFVELVYYNVIGEKSYPNIMGFLSGKAENVSKDCDFRQKEICGLIFSDLRSLNYLTIYDEDFPRISTFGDDFGDPPPTDLYYLPMAAMEVDRMIPTAPWGDCFGAKTNAERILDDYLDVATTHRDVPKFGFFWSNAIAHDDPNGASGHDRILVEFFKTLNKKNLLNDAIIIFLSDHGYRSGRMRASEAGWLETRMPFSYVRLPSKFVEKYPEFNANFLSNAEKLTTPLDLYATFQHLLELDNPDYSAKPVSAAAGARSLFHPIPHRDCTESGIPLQYCTCLPQKRLNPNETIPIRMAKMMAERIHETIKNHPRRKYCTNLKLVRVVNAFDKGGDGKLRYYLVQALFTKNANYESFALHDPIEDSLELLQVHRMDFYKNTALCMDNPRLKPYCVCS